MPYCYILKSEKVGAYYIGCTNDLMMRLAQHNNKYVISTKYRAPWQLIYYETFSDLKDARQRELQIKKWKSRIAIERLLKAFTK